MKKIMVKVRLENEEGKIIYTSLLGTQKYKLKELEPLYQIR